MQGPIHQSQNNDVLSVLMRGKLQANASRRQLLARAGMLGAAVAGANLLPIRRFSNMARGAEVAVFKPSTGKGFKVNAYDILNFALNLEYLEATVFSYAAFGKDITEIAGADITSGPGEGALQGTLPTVANSFVSPATQRLAQELAVAEIEHIKQIRTTLGSRAVGRPALDIPGGFTKEYSLLFSAAGLTTSDAPATFTPFQTDGVLGDAGFLVAAFALEDVGVTAYNGAAPYLSGQVLADASSILATEGYHAGATRYAMYDYSITYPGQLAFLQPVADAIITLENAASALGNAAPPPTGQPLVGTDGTPYFANADPTTGLTYARSFDQILNIVYLNTTATPTPGGYYPNGFNGRIR